MTQFEQAPPAERPCATCPSRSKISQALARAGLFRSGEHCAGTDVIDRFKVVKIVGIESFPEDSGDYTLLIDSLLSDNPEPTIGYFQQDHNRTESCPKDPILLAPDEVVTEVRINNVGKMRARIAQGDPENIRQIEPPVDRHLLNNDSRPPLEILRSVRLVTIATGSGNAES